MQCSICSVCALVLFYFIFKYLCSIVFFDFVWLSPSELKKFAFMLKIRSVRENCSFHSFLYCLIINFTNYLINNMYPNSCLWWPSGRHDKLVSIDDENLFLWSLDSSRKAAQVRFEAEFLEWSSVNCLFMLPSSRFPACPFLDIKL